MINQQLLLLSGVSLASAFMSHSSAPFALPRTQFASTLEVVRPGQATYSLGLGRHPPVGPSQLTVEPPTNVYAAVQYWVEHESAVHYPSPLLPPRRTTSPPATQRRPSPPPQERPAHVVIHNVDAQPVAVQQDRDLDLNTAWVEMLLHEQQQKVKFA